MSKDKRIDLVVNAIVNELLKRRNPAEPIVHNKIVGILVPDLKCTVREALEPLGIKFKRFIETIPQLEIIQRDAHSTWYVKLTPAALKDGKLKPSDRTVVDAVCLALYKQKDYSPAQYVMNLNVFVSGTIRELIGDSTKCKKYFTRAEFDIIGTDQNWSMKLSPFGYQTALILLNKIDIERHMLYQQSGPTLKFNRNVSSGFDSMTLIAVYEASIDSSPLNSETVESLDVVNHGRLDQLFKETDALKNYFENRPEYFVKVDASGNWFLYLSELGAKKINESSISTNEKLATFYDPVVEEEKERQLKEKLEKERLEKERLERERLEQERLERERQERERLQKERQEQEWKALEEENRARKHDLDRAREERLKQMEERDSTIFRKEIEPKKEVEAKKEIEIRKEIEVKKEVKRPLEDSSVIERKREKIDINPMDYFLLAKNDIIDLKRYGLLGELIPQITANDTALVLKTPIFLNTSSPSCVLVIGEPESGRSESVVSMIESNVLNHPPYFSAGNGISTLVLHFDQGALTLCDAVTMTIPENSEMKLAYKMTILMSPNVYKERSGLYSNIPDCEVWPLLFKWNDLNYSQIISLLRVFQFDNEPSFYAELRNVLRKLQKTGASLDFETFKQKVMGCELNGQDLVYVKQRLNLLESFLVESEENASLPLLDLNHVLNQESHITIADLNDPMLSGAEVNGIFQTLVNKFLLVPQPKLIVFDKSEEYMVAGEPDELSKTIVSVSRHMKKYNTSIVISAQNPMHIPFELFEFVSMNLIHRCSSVEWFKLVQSRLNLSEDNFQTILNLPNSNALLVSSKFSPLFGYNYQGVTELRLRPRLTKAIFQ